jgi:2-C-methyl-D-erythritol 4-phosphate cytidylyltransferase
MKKFAIIVAGGTGARMRGDVPKQFMLLNGKPVIQYSMEAFVKFDALLKIIMVLHPEFIAYWEKLCQDLNIAIPHIIVKGGKTRFESVKNGLDRILEDGLVAVHDAARPLVDTDFIEQQFSSAESLGSSVPGIAVNDTIRMVEGDSSRQLDRCFLRAMQTPQVFSVSELQKAYQQPFQPLFTDEASVMESAGFALHLTQGSPFNIKITNSHDIAVAEALIKEHFKQ